MREKVTAKGHAGKVECGGNVLCFPRTSGYMGVHMCQTSLNYMLKMGMFYCT